MSNCHKDKKISEEQTQLIDEALSKVYDAGFENGRRFQAQLTWSAVEKGDFVGFGELQEYLQNVMRQKEKINDKR